MPRKRLEPWMIVSAAWIVPALLGAMDAAAQQKIWSADHFDIRPVLFTSIDWLLYGFLTPFVFALARRYPIIRPNVRRNAVRHVLYSLLFCIVWATLGTILRLIVQPMANASGPDYIKGYLSWIFTTFPFGVAVYLAMVAMEHAIHYFVEARDRETQLARLSEQLTSARLSALQAQLNPHFLFNSLNTVTVLVRDGNGPAATRVIEQLSDVLRTTLGRSRSSEVSLDDELELVRQYLAVEQARFSDRLRPEFEIPPDLLSAAVPSFALQHLVENAIRHGIARRSDAGRVTITALRDGASLEVTVTDDGPGIAPDAAAPQGHGLENTRERLRTLYGDGASLEVKPAEQGTVAVLRVPYHEVVLEATHAAER